MSRFIILSAIISMVVAAGQQQFHFANFEDKHMQDTHGIQVNDEVAFFKIHDDNGDGFWDEADLRAMYGIERDIDPNAHHVRTIVDRALQDLDMDKDGKISLEEYMKSQLPDWTPEEIREEKVWMDHHPPQTGTPKSFDGHHNDQPEWNEGEEQEEQRHHGTGDYVPDKFKANF